MLNVFSPLVLEITLIVADINWVVDNSDSTDEVWSLSEVNRVVSVDVSDEAEFVFTIVTDGVDNVLVCCIEESV